MALFNFDKTLLNIPFTKTSKCTSKLEIIFLSKDNFVTSLFAFGEGTNS